jgi:hypothetical protein
MIARSTHRPMTQVNRLLIATAAWAHAARWPTADARDRDFRHHGKRVATSSTRSASAAVRTGLPASSPTKALRWRGIDLGRSAEPITLPYRERELPIRS